VDLIAAEDTRRTSKLLAHYDVRKPLVSLHEHNEDREGTRLVSQLSAGQNIALVSDAGTPTIADPGHRLVAAARHAGIRVVPIPGVSAVVTGLSASGQPADQFVFLGFPPSSGLGRERWFEQVAQTSITAVFYESPHRIERTISELVVYLVKRPVVVCRELTKINEELVEWSTKTTIRALGEFVVVIGPAQKVEAPDPDEQSVAVFVGQVIDKLSLDEAAALTVAAAHFAIPISKVRKLLKKGRILLKRSSDNLLP
jgi:16S rRNA (cytidine1402-2'-O)-methyltransferase